MDLEARVSSRASAETTRVAFARGPATGYPRPVRKGRLGFARGFMLLLSACTTSREPPQEPTRGPAPILSSAPSPAGGRIDTTEVAGADRDAERRAADEARRAASPRNSNGTRKAFPPGPPDLPGKTLLLDYGHFGPQALAAVLLGEDHYPFGAWCCSEYGDRTDVRVVVTRNISLDDAKTRYPTGEEIGDYRIVPAEDAIAFIRASLRDLRSWRTVDRIPTLERKLEETEARIVAKLGDPGASRASGTRAGAPGR